jgi:hypothetical protein
VRAGPHADPDADPDPDRDRGADPDPDADRDRDRGADPDPDPDRDRADRGAERITDRRADRPALVAVRIHWDANANAYAYVLVRRPGTSWEFPERGNDIAPAGPAAARYPVLNPQRATRR